MKISVTKRCPHCGYKITVKSEQLLAQKLAQHALDSHMASDHRKG